MARPKAEIDIAEVERLAGLGLTQEEIAATLGINEKTLRRRKAELSVLSDAIKRGRAAAGVVVANELFTKCKGGDLGAIIWYEKTRRGLSDKLVVDLSKLTDDQLSALVEG